MRATALAHGPAKLAWGVVTRSHQAAQKCAAQESLTNRCTVAPFRSATRPTQTVSNNRAADSWEEGTEAAVGSGKCGVDFL